MITALLILSSYVVFQILPGHDVRIHLQLADTAGAGNSLVIGFHRDASDDFDLQLGEMPVPPLPLENVFDARIVDLPGRERIPSTGSYVDMRKLVAPSQVDTFVVRFRTAMESYPITLSWDPSVRESCGSLTLIFQNGEQEEAINMLETTQWRLTDASVSSCQIVWCGVK